MKTKNYSAITTVLILTLFSTSAAFADVKIKIRQTMSGQTMENTTYIKGKRQRAEQNLSAEMQTVNITQCDLKRDLRIMPQSQTFMVNHWEPAERVTPSTTTKTVSTPKEKGGVVVTTYTTKDTGERRQMFGYTARHLIITMETEPSPDACQKEKTKMQFDGWYIDAAFALDCQTEQYQGYSGKNYNSGCQDRYEMKQIGAAKKGYPLYEKMTMFDASGKETYSMINEVVELSKATLDTALFEVPNGFREVKDQTELYASMSSQSANNSVSMNQNNSAYGKSNDSGMSQNVKNMANANSKISSEVGAKKDGVIRIGLPNVKTGAVGEGLSAADLAAAIQNTLGEYLKGTKIELVALEAKLAAAVDAEAAEKQCDFVLYATVSHKKGGGGGFGFGKMIGQVVGQTGIGHTGSTVGNIAGQMATTAIVSAGNMSANVKSKDEITLDINLKQTSGANALVKQFKAKAKSNGEDIISPIVEQAATAIVSAAKV
jgi:hypothetical protein